MVRVLRWFAVPLSFAAGIVGAGWLFVDMRLACLHFGARPENLCSDWWYASHAWIAVAATGLCAFALSVLIPVLLAPTCKRIVAFSAFVLTLSLIIANFTSPVRWWLVLICTIAAAIAALAVLVRIRRNLLPTNEFH